MPPHKVLHKTVTLKNNTVVQIKYWADEKMICVAAFDGSDNQLSAATYQSPVEFADEFYQNVYNKTLIEGLVGIVEGDLMNNPGMHIKK
ncbi:MAG: hypothetical protein ACOYL3_13755 [Desulfuromonadaceae bacterium]